MASAEYLLATSKTCDKVSASRVCGAKTVYDQQQKEASQYELGAGHGTIFVLTADAKVYCKLQVREIADNFVRHAYAAARASKVTLAALPARSLSLRLRSASPLVCHSAAPVRLCDPCCNVRY